MTSDSPFSAITRVTRLTQEDRTEPAEPQPEHTNARPWRAQNLSARVFALRITTAPYQPPPISYQYSHLSMFSCSELLIPSPRDGSPQATFRSFGRRLYRYEIGFRPSK